MKRFACGVIVGLVLGLAAASSASYIVKERWQWDSAGSLFHLGYVAGVVDTVEVFKGGSFFTRQGIAEALDAISRCTGSGSVLLRDLTNRAENAISNGPSSINAALVILGDLKDCR